MTRPGSGRSGSRLEATDKLGPMLARRIAAASLALGALGVGGATLAGTVVVLAAPATASAPASATRPAASASTDPPASSAAPAPTTILPTGPPVSAQPTDTQTAPTDAPTEVATTQAAPTLVSSPTAVASATATAKPRATSTASIRVTGTPRPTATVIATHSTYVYRTYAPVTTPTYYNPQGTTETGAAYPYTGAAGDLPSGAAATGAPLTKGTVKPATSADPVYVQATSAATTTARKYIDVSGISVDSVLGDAAIAGGILGLLGGVGLWFTRGAR